SYHSSVTISGQYTGACETNSFPYPFSATEVIIFVKKNKALERRVNAGTFECAAHNGVPPPMARGTGEAIFHQARLAPSGNRQDHGTKGPCFSIPALPDQFHRLCPQRRRQCSSNARALFAPSPCLADGMTGDRSFSATVLP